MSMVSRRRLERPTLRLGGIRSIQLSYRDMGVFNAVIISFTGN